MAITSIAIASVVNERTQTEQRLNLARASAEQLVVDRTSELAAANATLEMELARRTEAEENLVLSEERYRLLFERNASGICLATEDGTILECNNAFSDSLGFKTPAELTTRSIKDIYYNSGERPALIANLRTHKQLNNVEICFRRKDNTLLWALVNLTAVERDGKSVIVGSMIDMTSLKAARQQLQELSSSLMRAQDEERRRVARELHDSIGQLLAALKMQIGMIAARNGQLPSESGKALLEVNQTVDDVVKSVRTLSHLLHPPLLDEAGLACALRWYVDEFAKRSGLQACLNIDEDLARYNKNVETAIFRIVQECLTNVHLHSKSENVYISVSHANDRSLEIEVRDQGIGISKQAQNSPGVGIRGMRERVSMLGGQLIIQSGDTGTTVIAKLPTSAESADITARVV